MTSDKKLVVAVEADTAGFEAALSQITATSKKFGDTFSASLSQAIVKGKNFEDTLRSIALNLSQVAFNSALKPLENIVSGVFSGLLSGQNSPTVFAKGGAFGAGGPIPFARGGVVSSPSFFNFGGETGLMGEAGAEAILPLSRGPDGKLGIAAGKESSAPINIVFNVSANDAASFRRSQSQISTMLTRAVARGNRNI